MTDREKLIERFTERLKEAYPQSDRNNPNHAIYYDDFCDIVDEVAAEITDIIANGVPVQQWIPVTERLPQEDEPAGATCEQVQVLLSDGFVTTGWCNRGLKVWFYLPYGETRFIGNDYEKSPVIAWQPLAQPPKEE